MFCFLISACARCLTMAKRDRQLFRTRVMYYDSPAEGSERFTPRPNRKEREGRPTSSHKRQVLQCPEIDELEDELLSSCSEPGSDDVESPRTTWSSISEIATRNLNMMKLQGHLAVCKPDMSKSLGAASWIHMHSELTTFYEHMVRCGRRYCSRLHSLCSLD